jgi:hypothetical protein
MRWFRGMVGAALVAASLGVTGVGSAAATTGEPAPSDCTIVGTNGPDVLIGGLGRDVICGRGGDDHLIGLTGDDVLDGGSGHDTIVAGPGDDLVRAHDGVEDRIECGPGRDRVVRDDVDSTVGCETRVPDTPPADASKSRAYGPGLEGGAVGDTETFFVELNTATGQRFQGDVGTVPLVVQVVDPSGADVPVTRSAGAAVGVVELDYVPPVHGTYVVTVSLDGQPLPGSPFSVPISRDPNAADPTKSRAYGPGLEGGTVGVTATFYVELNTPSGQRYAGNAGDVPLVVSVTDPNGDVVPVLTSVSSPGTLQCDYLPNLAGTYVVRLSIDGEPLPGSPFHVTVVP